MAADARELEIPGVATIVDGPGGLPVLSIETPAAQARIFFQGAQLTHWQPAYAKPVIFLSERSTYAPGKAIRGGVPVCFPWFGPRTGEAAHGFARNRPWQLTELAQEAENTIRAVFADAADEI